jgi:uncharacterized protein
LRPGRHFPHGGSPALAWHALHCIRATMLDGRDFSPDAAQMPFHVSSPYLLPIGLLICSNLFMTIAWYGHLRFKGVPLLGVIAASWAIAFVEYCFAVPANRYGNAVYSAAQLKTMQEVITLLVFAGFSLVYLKEPIGWNHLVGFALISAGAFFIFQKW